MEFSNKFVCATREYSTYERAVSAPYFRRSFFAKRDGEAAQITICGLGFYALFINGEEITKGLLAPYVSNPDHFLYYDNYDLSPYIKEGENVIGVWLGNGILNTISPIWEMDKAAFRSAPKFACTVSSESETFDAESFKWAPSPLYFDGYREGNFYDARKEIPNWNKIGFDDSDFKEPLKADTPRGEKKLCKVEPIKISKEHKCTDIFEGTLEFKNYNKDRQEFNVKYFEEGVPKTGGYIYDFGINMSGISRLRIRGERGQKIRIVYSDHLDERTLDLGSSLSFFPDGFGQSDLFICSGGEDVFEQRFTYYGYRYAYVVGITKEQAVPSLLTALEASSELKKIGNFECSDPDANALYKMARQSDISNFYYFLTDCPHREKNGWTGDASMSSEHIMQTLAAENSLREWLFSVRKAQREDGSLPGIVPTDTWGYEWGNGPAWDSVLFNIPYFVWKYRGNDGIIEENAAAMLSYLEYLSRKRTENGLLEFGLGDWAPVEKIKEDTGEAPLCLTDTIMGIDMCRKAAEMFDGIGLNLSSDFANGLLGELMTAARENLIDFDTMTALGRCESSQAMAIFYGLFKDSEKAAAFKVLRELIAENDDSMSGGYLGLRVLFHVLAEFSEYDLAYDMIVKREFPSYGSILSKGFTTLPEQFFRDYKGKVTSFNHHFFGDIENFFTSKIAGLRIISETEAEISPCFAKKLDFAKAEYVMKNGEKVFVSWKRNGEEIEITFGGNCKFVVPRGYEIVNEESGKVTVRKI